MADRFPLILNTSTNQIQEIPSGDNLDLTGTGINNAGIITAGNVTIGAATTDLVVNGDARVTGILTVGTSSLKLDGPNNLVNVGTALTLGHSQGLQFHTQNLHSAGFEVNQINASGIITATEADINGDLDVDGHTNLDNVNVVGVVTVTGAVNASHSTFGNLNTTGITIQNTNASLNFTDTNNNPDYSIIVDGGVFDLNSVTPAVNIIKINTDGHIDIGTNVDFAAGIDVTGNVIASGNVSAVDGTFTGNVSVGGTLTYEDVTNVDSVGLVTARDGIFIPDNKELKIGNTAASSDLRIYSNGNESFVDSYGGNFYIRVTDQAGGVENKLIARPNAQTELYFNDAKKLETTSTGISVTGQGVFSSAITASTYIQGTSSNGGLKFYSDSSASKGVTLNTDDHLIPSHDSTSDLGLTGTRWRYVYADALYGDGSNLTGIDTDLVSDTSPQLGGDLDVNSNKIKGGHTIYEIVTNTRHKFDCNGSTIMNINAGGVDFSVGHNTHSDNVENRHGTHNDIRIYHSGSHSYIKNTTDYTLWIQNEDSQSVIVSNNSGGNKSASFNIGAAAELYHANNKKFETTSTGTHHSDFTHTFGASGGVPTLKAGGSNTDIRIAAVGTGGWIDFATGNSSAVQTSRWKILGTTGNFVPDVNNDVDIGSSTKRVKNIYTNDLNLSNEGGANDVDNTWGDYTIQEGESDLFLINNRSGKKYKFNLTEVS